MTRNHVAKKKPIKTSNLRELAMVMGGSTAAPEPEILLNANVTRATSEINAMFYTVYELMY